MNTWNRWIASAAGAMTLLGLAAPASAGGQDTLWINDLGGDFGTPANWAPAIPGPLDTAVFDLGTDYSVSFAVNASCAALFIPDDEVTLLLSGRTLAVGGLAVGNNLGHVGLLNLAGGFVTVSSNDFLRLAKDPGSMGELTVLSSASLTMSTDAIVGDGGAGTLSISGTMTSANAFVGDDPGATGLVTVAGGSYTVNGATTIGNFGNGEMQVLAGGVATLGGLVRIGDELGADGRVLVQGAGSQWSATGETFVGNNAVGSMTADTGAMLTTTRIKIGDEIGASGTVVIDGTGTTWQDSVEIFVGNFGTGDLTVSGGGSVQGVLGTIADDPPSVGTVTVSGAGSTWTSSQMLTVGDLGTGTLTLAAGGRAEAASIRLGGQAGGGGLVIIDGPGSSLETNGSLVLGVAGTGTLRILNGGQVTTGSYSSIASSRLEAVLGPNSASPLVTVTNTATVAGELIVTLVPGYDPAAGTEIDLMTASQVNGTFAATSIEAPFELVGEAGRLVLRVKGGTPCLPDLDGSSAVDFGDLLAVLSAWGPCGGTCAADLDGSGAVDFGDLLMVLSSWGPCP